MRLNDSLKLLLNIKNYNDYTSNRLVYPNTSSLNKYDNNCLDFKYFKNKRDSIYISDIAQQLSLNYKEINSMKKINNEKINILKSKDNTLDFKAKSYYDFPTNNEERIVLTTDKHGNITMPFDDLKLKSDSISISHRKEIDRIEKFFTYLSSDSSALLVNLNYKENEVKDILSRVGIEPGFFKIKNESKTNEFYLLENGQIYSKHQSEAHRFSLNNKNFFRDGYTQDSTFIIDGKEYKPNTDGYLNIPEGTACLAETIKIIK